VQLSWTQRDLDGTQEFDMHNSEKRELVTQLASFPFLAGCSSDDVAALANSGSPRTLPDGWAFVQEGTPADACYVLLAGTVRVFSGRQVIASMSTGDVIGEMAYLAGGQRKATVSTHGRVKVLRIEYETLTKLLARRPALDAALRTAYNAHRATPTADGPSPA